MKKNSMRLLGFLLVAVMVVSLLGLGVFAGDTANDVNDAAGNVDAQSSEADLVINSVDDLLDFAESVNSGDTYSGEIVALGSDLDLTGLNWTPIGGWDGAVQFLGEFDGNGKTIFNLTINDTDVTAAKYRSGFFADLGQGSSVHDLTFDNVTVTNTKGGQVGALSGRSGADLETILVNGFEANVASGTYAGAVVGITNYYSSGDYGFSWDDVDAKGVTIAFKGSETSYGGGLLGGMNPNGARLNTYENCDVTDVTITDENIGLHGGMWGWHGRSGAFDYVKNCSVTNVNITTSGTGDSRVGGICGFVGVSGGLFENVTVNGGNLVAGGGYAGGFTPWSYAWGQDTYKNCSVENVNVTCETGMAGGFIAAAGAGNQTSKCIDCAVVGGTVTGRIASGFAASDRVGNAGGAYILNGCTSSAAVTGTEYAAGLIARASSSYQTVVTGSEFTGTVSGDGYVCEGVITTHTDKSLLDVSGVPVMYINIKDGEGNPTVETYRAAVNGKYYETLADAIDAANTVDGGATVTLLADVILGEKLTITGDVTIEGAYTITRADAYTGTLFAVEAGATLTLDGGLTIDGGNAWTYTVFPPLMDMDNGAGTTVAEHITPAEGGVNATAHMIVNNGTLNVHSVTIENSYSTGGFSLINAGANSVTILDGATIRHTAANRSGAVAYVGGSNAILTIKGTTRITDNFGVGNGGIIQNYGQGTTVNLEGGSIDNNFVGKSGTLYASYSGNADKINTFNMTGGIITKNVMEGYGPVYIHTNTVWNMSGGEISENVSYLPSYVRNNNPAGSMTGGKIANNEITCLDYNGGYYLTHPDLRLNGKTAITGGIYSQNVFEYLAPNTGLAYDDGLYTVVSKGLFKLHLTDPVTGEPAAIPYIEGNALASLVATGKLFYADYYEMTLEVLYDVKVDETVVIDYPMTIDLNGHTITGYSTMQSIPVFRVVSDVTVIGEGKVDGRPGTSSYAFIVGQGDNAGNLTIENGTFYGDTSAISVTKGTATINGGKFAVTPYQVEGEEDNYNFLLNCIDKNYKDGTAKIVVKGGTFYKFNPADNAAEGANTSFVHEDYLVETDGDYYSVRLNKDALPTVADVVIKLEGGQTITLTYPSERFDTIQKLIGTNDYADFVLGAEQSELLAYVANGDVTDIVMNLYDDIELDAPINFYNKYFQIPVEYAITVNGNGHTISWADGYNGTLINVENGVSVTLKDLTIDGENAFTFYDDTTTVENGQNWYTRFVDVGEEDKAINDNVIVNAGNLTLDSVRITGVTIASDGPSGKTENTESGYVLMYNDDLALIKSNGGKVTINGGAIMYNAGMVLNAINAETSLSTNVMYNMGAGNKGGIIIANGGTMDIKGVITYNKAMARSATILGVINGAEVAFNAVMNDNEHIGVGSNTAGAMIVLEGASEFVMNGGTINYNEGGRAGAIASRWAGKDTSIVLNAGSIIGNTASNNSWNGASIFLRSPATIGEGMTIDGTIAVNAAPGALEITGGTFNNFAMIVTDGLVAEITGGTFDSDPTEWVAEGYATVYSDGYYTVKPVIAEIFFSAFGGSETSVTYPGYADSLQELVDYYMFCNNANETAFPGFSFGDYTPVLVIYGGLSAEDVAYLGGASTDGTYVSAKPMTWTVRFADGVDASNNIKAAEGYAKVDNGDGTFTVQKAVAKVGDTYFATLQDAFAACTNGETITLLVDLVYDADDVVYPSGGATGFGKYDQYNPSIIYIGGTKGATEAENQPSNVNAVLDLNGHTITNNADAYLFLFMDNCKVTIKDSKDGDGIIGNTEYPVIWVTGTDTLVTIESGKYTTANAEGLLWSTHGGDLVIKGGEFSTSADDASLLIIRNAEDRRNPNYFVDGKATVTIYGGTFYGFDPEKMMDDSTDPFTEFDACADGYKSIKNGNAYTVVNYIEWIKQQLLLGNDVVLEKDIVVDGSMIESIPAPTNGNGRYPNYGIFNVVGDYDVTFDLNGHSITYNGHKDFEWNGKTYNSCTVAHGLFFANDGAHLTIVGEGDIIVNGVASGVYSASPDTAITIQGGNWVNNGCAECGATNLFLYASHGGELYIEGGRFEQALDSEGNSYLIVVHGGEYKNSVIDFSQTKIVVTGGTFVGMDPSKAQYFQQTADNTLVMGETVDTVDIEYMVVKDGDTYTVTKWNYEIWTKADLEKLSAIVNGGNTLEGVTVKLMADINLYEVDENGNRVTFAPIANNGSFNGIFEGNDHTISNLYQSGWALGYEWGSYGAIGLFGNINGATIRNLTIADAECFVEGGDVGAIAGSAEGDCTLEGITVKNSTFATYNNGCGGLIGWAGAGHFTFKDIEVDEDTVIAGLWGSFDSSLGGILGQLDDDASAHFENVHVACRIDAYNDVTASYKWYSYRMCGMLIGRVLDVQQINGTNYPDPAAADVTIGENVVVTFGDWANYHYIWNDSLSRGCQRVEAGYEYGGIDITQYPDSDISYIPFRALFGGPQSQYQGYYGLNEYEGVLVNFPASAAIGEKKYWTLEDAFAAAKDGDVITLLKDITLYDTIVTKTEGAITLDLDGYTITTENGINPAIRVLTDLTVKNGTMDTEAYCFIVGSTADDEVIAGNLTIESGSYTGTTSVVSVTKGTLTVLGGEFKTAESAYGATYLLNCIDAYYKDGTASIVVKGGRFYGFNPENNAAEGADTNFVPMGYRASIYGTIDGVDVYDVVELKATVEAGSITYYFPGVKNIDNVQELTNYYFLMQNAMGWILGYDYEPVLTLFAELTDEVVLGNTPSDDTTVTLPETVTWTIVTNGFNADLIKAAEGYAKVDNGDGTITIQKAVAKIGDVYFGSLQDAIDAANKDGDTIEFLTDITEDVTVNKNVTINGAEFKYTGTMTLNKVNVTIENVNFVSGTVYKNKKTGAGVNITIKNCTFDGQGLNTYAVNLGGTGAIVIENVTAKNYGYGFLQVPTTNNSISIKDVTVESVNYGFKIDYSNGVTIENVNVKANVAGLLNSNYGEKTITIKDSYLSILGTWTRNSTTKTTIVFDGQNTVDEFAIDETVDNLKLNDVESTLTAPAGATVTTDAEGYTVVYVNGTYKAARVITVTFGDATMVYGNALPEFTYTTDFTEIAEDGLMLVVPNPVIDVTGVGEYEITSEAYVFMNDDYVVVVVPGTLTVQKAALSVDGVYFADWASAKDSITKNSEIKLFDDVEYGMPEDGSNKYVEYKFAPNLGVVSIDLNGYDLTFHHTMTVQFGTTLIIKDLSGSEVGTLSNTNSSYPFVINPKTVVDLQNGVNFDCTIQMNTNNGVSGYLQIDGKNIIGEDESLFVTGDSTLRLTLKENYLYVNTVMGTLTLAEDWTTLKDQTVIIGANTGVTIPEGVTLTIDPTTSLTLKGYLKGEGTVVVNSAEHLNQMLAESTVANIKLGANIETDVIVDREVVLDLNGKTLTGALTVAENGKLTVVDSTITDNFDDAGSVIGDVTVNGKLTLYAGTYSEDVTDYCAQYYIARDNKNGTWTVCYGFVYNETSGKTFATIAEAMADARTNEYDHDVIILLQDHEESIVIIYDGTTLNLKSHTLKADYVVGFNGGYLTGNTYKLDSNAYGRLVVAKNNVILGQDAFSNGKANVIPVWDKDEDGEDHDGAYIFSQVLIYTEPTPKNDERHVTYDAETKIFSAKFKVQMSSSLMDPEQGVMVTDTYADHGVSIIVRSTWVDADGIRVQDYHFKDEVVQKCSAYGPGVDSNDLTFRIPVGDRQNFTLTILVVTDAGTVVSTATYPATSQS